MKIDNRTSRRFFSGIKIYCLLFNLFAVTQSLAGVAEWTILIYAQAKNSLSSFAHKNFHDMSLVGSNKDLNLLVQWYQPDQQGVWRYKIEKGRLDLDVCLSTATDGNSSQDLV